MRLLVFFSLVLGFVSWVAPSHAQVHIIVSSDQHSQDNNLERALKAQNILTNRFLSDNPRAKLWYLMPGDIAGPSEWTDLHKGKLTYDVIARISRFRHVVATLGNHEAFSYSYPTLTAGHVLFLEQTKAFYRDIQKFGGQKTTWTAANVVAEPGMEALFQPYEDATTPTGHRVRTVGLVLDDWFNAASYDRNSDVKVIAAIRPMLEVAKENLEKAASDGIQTVIFQMHQGADKITSDFVPQLMEWKRGHSDARVRDLKIPLVLASHNHMYIDRTVEGVRVLESGSRHCFSEVVLENDGNIRSVEYFDWSRQDQLLAKESDRWLSLRPSEKEALRLTVESMNKQAHLMKPVLTTPGFNVIRADMRKGPQELGSLIADSFRLWAETEAPKFAELPKNASHVSFFESSAFRRDDPIPPGPLSRATLMSIYPFLASMAVGVMSGEDLEALHRWVRMLFIKKEYTPQLSSNLREKAPGMLEILRDGKWQQVLNTETYVLSLDRFQQQRYIKAIEAGEIPFSGRWIETPRERLMRDVIADGFGKAYENLKGRTQGRLCRDSLSLPPNFGQQIDKK